MAEISRIFGAPSGYDNWRQSLTEESKRRGRRNDPPSQVSRAGNGSTPSDGGKGGAVVVAAPERTLTIAVVGAGYWGSKHVRVLQGLSGVEVVIVEANEDRRHMVASSFPGFHAVPDIGAALDDIDAAVVATPPRTHADVALALLRHGKHVLVEKPMATGVEAALAMIKAAADSGAQLMAGHTFEYNPAVATLRSIIHDGQLGRLHYIDSSRLNLGLYQSDVNVLWDLAPHDISIVNHLLDAEPVEVSVWASAHAHRELQDVAYLLLQYDVPDVVAHIHVSWLYPRKVRQFAVVGDQRMAVYNDTETEERIRIYDKSVASSANDEAPLSVPTVSYRYGGIISPYVDPAEPLALEDQHFVDCIRQGCRPRSDAWSGLAVVRVLEAAELARQTGRPVQLADMEGTLTPYAATD
jgi:predicted dehydrogenase